MIETIAPESFSPMDARTALDQIGAGNVAAISGGRVEAIRTPDGEVIGIRLPVRFGYRVEVLLAANDTYTVRRVFERGGRRWVKGERTDVYCEDLGEAAYVASCYVNRVFGEHDPEA